MLYKNTKCIIFYNILTTPRMLKEVVNIFIVKMMDQKVEKNE